MTTTIKPKKKAGKTIKMAKAPVNKAGSCSFAVTLKKATYTWIVQTSDIAGNVGKTSPTRKLVVR